MSRLEALRAEREAIEQAEEWDHAALPWLCEEIEKLEAQERAKLPAPAATTAATEPQPDPVAALVAEMNAAAANPGRLSDAEREALVRRYNDAVNGTRERAEVEDAAQVQRAMLEAAADPSKLDDDQRAALMARYNRLAGQQQPTARADSPDLAERMRAALQAQERGEEVDVPGLMAQFEAWQTQQLAASRDPANLPPELQEAGKVLYAAEAEMNRPADPVAHAIDDLNRFVRGMKPPSLAEQLEALGVQPEPELVSTASTESTGAGE